MKIGILYICTGNYTIFWQKFYLSMEKYFLPGVEKYYFIFTDAPVLAYEKENAKIHRIHQENLGWPNNTLKRFHMFLTIRQDLESMEYVFFFNANLQIMQTIGADEFLPKSGENLLAVLHPGFYNKDREKFTYENDPRSTAYIPASSGIYYFAGGLMGGQTRKFLEAVKIIAKNIDIDSEKEVTALWHDESHWNKYLVGRKDIHMLSPAFLYPEDWKLPFEIKILVRDKNKYGGHSALRNGKTIAKEKVSIVMPVYNGEKYLKEAIVSIQNQTFKNWELIIVDDFSTDNSLEFAQQYAERDPRIKTLENKEKGLPSALNLGLDSCTGELIARADSDDINEPDRLKKQLEFLMKQPEIDIVGSANRLFGTNTKKRIIHHPRSSVVLAWRFVSDNHFCHPSVMFRKSLLKTVSRYPNVSGEDFPFFSKIIQKHKGSNLREVLLNYRQHNSNLSNIEKEEISQTVRNTFRENFKFYTGSLENAELFFKFHARHALSPENTGKILKLSFAIAKRILNNYHEKKIGFNALLLYAVILRDISMAIFRHYGKPIYAPLKSYLFKPNHE